MSKAIEAYADALHDFMIHCEKTQAEVKRVTENPYATEHDILMLKNKHNKEFAKVNL